MAWQIASIAIHVWIMNSSEDDRFVKQRGSTGNWKNAPIFGLLGLGERRKLIICFYVGSNSNEEVELCRIVDCLGCLLPLTRNNRVFCRKYFLCGLTPFWSWGANEHWNPKIYPCYRNLCVFLLTRSKVDQSENIFSKVTTAWENSKQTK